MKRPDQQKILITGAAGLVATGVRPFLSERYGSLVLADIRQPANVQPNEVFANGDISDFDFINRAQDGVDAILHLAASYGTKISFEETVASNYRSLFNVYESARLHRIRNIVFASSLHGWGYYPRYKEIPVNLPARPDGWYGVSKVFGEAVGALYAYKHGMSILSIRIGNADATVPDERRTHMWVSYRDLAKLVSIGLERKKLGHEVVYGVADCPEPFFDNSDAKRLGFTPEDNPMDLLARPEIRNEPAPDGVSGAVVGGDYAQADFDGDATIF